MTDAKTIQRLTALWAFSESGIGGLMHALKLPFTGFFLGGFAVIIVTIIANHSQNRWRDITSATLLVVLVKALVSPQSPPMAYFAVGFQGISGALIYALSCNRVSAVFYGGLALFESAIQKFITATLFFGKSIWQALDSFYAGIAKDLGLSTDISFSCWLIVTYTGVYTIWGLFLGFFAGNLHRSLHLYFEMVQQRMRELLQSSISESEKTVSKRKRKNKLVYLFLILGFVVSVFLISGNTKQAHYVILRTLGVLLLLLYIVGPFINYLLKRWIVKKQMEEAHSLQTILDQLPELKQMSRNALLLAQKHHHGLGRYIWFIRYLLVLALYEKK
jgi:hypothetical protein